MWMQLESCKRPSQKTPCWKLSNWKLSIGVIANIIEGTHWKKNTEKLKKQTYFLLQSFQLWCNLNFKLLFQSFKSTKLILEIEFARILKTFLTRFAYNILFTLVLSARFLKFIVLIAIRYFNFHHFQIRHINANNSFIVFYFFILYSQQN